MSKHEGTVCCQHAQCKRVGDHFPPKPPLVGVKTFVVIHPHSLSFGQVENQNFRPQTPDPPSLALVRERQGTLKECKYNGIFFGPDERMTSCSIMSSSRWETSKSCQFPQRHASHGLLKRTIVHCTTKDLCSLCRKHLSKQHGKQRAQMTDRRKHKSTDGITSKKQHFVLT